MINTKSTTYILAIRSNFLFFLNHRKVAAWFRGRTECNSMDTHVSNK